jgi:effector-binding domain-containing protein
MNRICVLIMIMLMGTVSGLAQVGPKAIFVGDIAIRAVPPMKAVTVTVKAADYLPRHGWAAGLAGLQQAYDAMLRNGYEKLARWMKEGGHPTGPSFVIFQQDPATAVPGALTCKIGYPVNERAKGKNVAKIESLPPMVAAVARYQGSFDDHPALRDSLQKWMASRGYEPSGPLMEVYLKGMRDEKDPDDLAEIRWPVRRLDESLDSGLSSSRK